MNIAVVGSSGYIAGYLLQEFEKDVYFDKILKIGRKENADALLDLKNAEKFDYEILDEIDVIVFTAAVSGPDQCAAEFEDSWKINVEGTQYFIKKAMEKKSRVIFFSSDAVYRGNPGEIYDEKSPTEPITPYGKMKKAVEDTFSTDCSYFKSVRLSYVVSSHDKFIKYCLECLKNNQVAEIYHPFYRNCISLSDVARTVRWLIFHWEEFKSGVLNLAGKELVSRVRIADELNRILCDRLKYRIVFPDPQFYKNRPKIAQMESLYLEKYSIIENNTFTKKIQNEMEEIEL